jgi:hypothetical protein
MAPLGCSYRAVRPYMEAYIWRRKQGKRVASMLAMAGDDEGVVPLALPCDPGGRILTRPPRWGGSPWSSWEPTMSTPPIAGAVDN